MTKEDKVRARTEKNAREFPSPRQLIFCFMSLFSLALIIKNSDVAIEYMSEGLRLCAVTVIPSLFPFMVLSDIIVSSGAATIIGKTLRAPMRLLFGVSGEGGCAVILGTLCGFPIGAKSAVSMYDSGRISREELERLLTFSNNPSSAFIISAVGVSLFGSRDFGYKLYAATLISSAIIGIAQNIFFKKKKKPPQAEAMLTNSPRRPDTRLGIGDFTEAVTSSAFGILKVCAFVIFFTAFLGTLRSALASVTLPKQANALLFGIFELTGGMSQAAAVLPREQGMMLAAFIAGWSGFSVHFQIMSLCTNRNISFKPYFVSKFAQGIVAAALVHIFM